MKYAIPFLALVASIASIGVRAEQADRNKPTQWAAARVSYDDLKQVTVLEGDVEIVRGTFVLHAQRVELRQDPEGFQYGLATGTAAEPARFRQKRDVPDQFIEGYADRIDYDGKADKVTLTGHADLKRLEGATLADEINGHVIVYDGRAEQYSAQGDAGTGAAPNPQGRVHGVIAPRVTPAPTTPKAEDTGMRSSDSIENAGSKK